MNHLEYKKKLETNKDYQEAKKDLKIQFDLAKAVITARAQKGLSQAQVAKLIGTKQANISRIEAGLGNPTINLIQKLAKALDFHIDLRVDLIPATVVDFIEASTSIKQWDLPTAKQPLIEQQNEVICFPKYSIASTSAISKESVPCN